jgi:hypothetical protein
MLEYAALHNPFKTSYFLWIDAGSFRHTHYRLGSWPNDRKIAQIFETNRSHKLLFSLVGRLPQELWIWCRLSEKNFSERLFQRKKLRETQK